jgi:glycosyltransferase involved in cell wall biosynthesis
MVTLEAMAHGLPCLVTPMGTSGAVTDKEGMIVEPGNVDQIAEALETFSRNTELRLDLGRAARHKAQDYTWSKVAQRRLAGLQEIHDSGEWHVDSRSTKRP